MRSALAELAARYAILPAYEGIDGKRRSAPDATLRRLLAAFGIDAATPEATAASLAAAPPRRANRLRAPKGRACHIPAWLETGRGWGIAIQLYALRSARNWGIGDFADLAALARTADAAGADFIGLNPLHALFTANPRHTSPFSPSNRRFLNPAYIAVDAVPGHDPADDPPRAALEAVRDTDLVDYPAVTNLKLNALRRLWQGGADDPESFARFCAAGGEPLRRHALFETISGRMTREGRGAGWLDWPQAWRDPAGDAVAAFAAAEAAEVGFHLWLQWLAARQLEHARRVALDAGMRIGLYLDFAVGEAPDGSSTWSEPEVSLRGLRVGAPPDYFNAAGQDWGLAPLSPVRVAQTRAAPFRDLMDAATRGAGALRIDHAMALWQLFLIPQGASPAEGTYVRYPVALMIEALAAASHAHRAVMIGEDLGNVPDGFRAVMDAANILSYRILFFERDPSGYIAPEAYPRNALVCLSTHDLPTLEGWWRGDDVALRRAFGLISDAAAATQAAARESERVELCVDLARAGLLAPGPPPEALSPALVVAAHRHLARAPSRLLAARIEDMTGQREPVNLPSTTDAFPNWRRKLPVTIEDLPLHPLFAAVTKALRAERPRSAG